MSIGSIHQFNALTKNSAALDNSQRLSRLIAKSDKDGKYASEHLSSSLCVSVPKILDSEIEQNIAALYPHIAVMLQGVQDSIIRDIRITTGAGGVHQDEFSVARCIAWMNEEKSGNRVTKEFLAKWFIDTYSEVAAEFIVVMNKWANEGDTLELSEEQMKVIEQKVAMLRDDFSAFSGGKYQPNMVQVKRMLKFGEFIGTENVDDLMQKYLDKCAAQKKKLEEEFSSDALGL